MVANNSHAILSASSSHRWLICTPSARLNENVAQKPSKASEEGTVAHKLAEIRINELNGQENEDENVYNSDYYCDEMNKHVNNFVKFVKKSTKTNSRLYAEQRVDFSDYVPEGFGTCDVMIVTGKTLHIIDLKYGKYPVNAVNNSQLRLYAWGGVKKFEKIENIIVTIYQPRINNISTEEFTKKELLQWMESEVKEQANKAFKGIGEYVYGSHCKFCNGLIFCQ